MSRGIFPPLLVLLLLINTKLTNSDINNGLNPILEAAQRSSSIKKLDECFCELSGPIDVCCCDVETVDTLNHDMVYPFITEIISTTFFRYFKINLNRHCPFWSDDGRCVMKDCHVEKCSEEDIPSFLREGNDTPRYNKDHIYSSCDEITDEEKQLSTVIIPDNISNEQETEFKEWSRIDDNFCHLEDDSSTDGSYIDLVLNPERFTGYSGHSPHRIWSAIYEENCFSESLQTSNIQDLCLEKRAFYQLISGLHASINIHLSAQYIISSGSSDNPKFGPNLDEFVRRFDTSKSNGQGPGWLKNLYFAYLVVLRSVIKAEDIWTRIETLHTFNNEDERVKNDILNLIKAGKRCGQNLFDESQLFTGDASEQLKDEFRIHFKNISRIMDCVGCDKCRLWGTIQIQGIGTALKILFNKQNIVYLSRQEIVALFNVLGRLSESIEYLSIFKQMKAPPISSNTFNRIEL